MADGKGQVSGFDSAVRQRLTVSRAHSAALACLPLRPRSAPGFTLIEVLVVVFLIGIILTMATLSIGSNDERLLEDEAKRAAYLIELARQEAVLEAIELAVVVKETGYGFRFFGEEGKWLPLDGDAILRERALPEYMRLEAVLDGEALQFVSRAEEVADESAESAGEKTGQEDLPRIFLLSSGEMTPFELRFQLQDRNGGYLVKGDALGQIQISEQRDLL